MRKLDGSDWFAAPELDVINVRVRGNDPGQRVLPARQTEGQAGTRTGRTMTLDDLKNIDINDIAGGRHR